MDAKKAKEILDNVVGQIFGYQNPFTLEQAMNKFAFDIRLPQQVYDSTTNEITWAQSTNPVKFIAQKNVMKRNEVDEWMLPKKKVENLQDVLEIWTETNFTTTERQADSVDIAECDSVYHCQNMYRSTDLLYSKNVLFSDGGNNLENIIASQRSNTSTFCIRIEDSTQCSNSCNVIGSGKITNCLFVQDCYDLFECMFCSHLSGKKYCIANMQFEEEEYFKLKKEVIHWALAP